jgi:hypothetical protein
MATLKVWNGSEWVEIVGPAGASGNTGPQGPQGDPGPTGDLGDLTDVTVGNLSDGDFLSWLAASGYWNNEQYNASDFLTQSHVSGETHFLTGDIDHEKIQNSHNLTTDIDHDQLTNYVANEHIDWTASSAGTIDPSNYTDNDTTDHTALSNIGTNTHAQIDTHIASTSNPHSVTAAQVGAITGLSDDPAPELAGSLDANAYTVSWEEQYAYGSAGSVALDFSAGNKWHIQVDADLTASFTDPAGATNLVVVTEQVGGNNTMVWPSEVLWPGGRTGEISTGAGAIDIVNMYYNGSGTYYGMTARDFQ